MKGCTDEEAPFKSLRELLDDAGSDLAYIGDLIEAQTNDPLPVLAARMGEDRSAFLDFIKGAGVQELAHRQRFCNALGKGVRTGRITKGWATSGPAHHAECHQCGKRAGPQIKLSTCARCKQVKYCSVACQKKSWASHKGMCIRPSENAKPYANLGAEPPSHTNALPGPWAATGRSFLPTK